jgi:hypothetical protein
MHNRRSRGVLSDEEIVPLFDFIHDASEHIRAESGKILGLVLQKNSSAKPQGRGAAKAAGGQDVDVKAVEKILALTLKLGGRPIAASMVEVLWPCLPAIQVRC